MRYGIWLIMLPLAGCASYTPQHLANMSTVELCEVELLQRSTLSEDGKRHLGAEIKRRSLDCNTHISAVQLKVEADNLRALQTIDDP